MLFSSSTNLFTDLGSLSTGIISDVKIYIFMIAGLILGFYVLERIIIGIFPEKYKMDMAALSEGFKISLEEEEEEENGDPPKGTEDYEIAKEEGDLSWQRR